MKKVKYSLYRTSEYERKLRKILRNDRELATKIESKMERIKGDSFAASLRTHRVNIPSMGSVYSSRVNGDIRIIWTLHEGNVILLQRIGGHSGSSKVYR